MLEKDLENVAGGIFIQQLKFVSQQMPKIAPEDIYLLLDPAKVESTTEDYFSRRAVTLEAVRNIFILLPILVTWLSLGLAAVAYAQIYSLRPDQSFLKLWADGFPGLQWWVPAFPTVAATDVLLLTFLIGLTVVIQAIEWNARRVATRVRKELDVVILSMVAASHMRALGAGPGDRKPGWAIEVQDAMNNLNFAVNGVRELVKDSQGALKVLVTTSQTTLENLINASQAKLEGSVREFSEALTNQRVAVNEFMAGAVDVRRAVDKLEHIYVKADDIYTGLNQTMPKIAMSFETMATHQNKAATVLGTISGHSDNATRAVSEIAQQFVRTELVNSTSRAAGQMQQSAKTMENVAVYVQNTVDKQIDLQRQLNLMAPRTPAQGGRKKKWWQIWK